MPLRFLTDPAASPARNMAVDESLLRHLQFPVLRLYSWDQPCVSIGYFQKATTAADRPFVRRYTGGGLVEHGRDLTYTLLLPPTHPLTTCGTLASYRKIHAALALALQQSGIPSALATAQPLADDPACFLKPVPADLLSPTGQKLAGAAQRRTKQGCLHQGSILLPHPPPPLLRQLLPQVLSTCLGEDLAPSTLTSSELAQAHSLTTERYATRAWNFSR